MTLNDFRKNAYMSQINNDSNNKQNDQNTNTNTNQNYTDKDFSVNINKAFDKAFGKVSANKENNTLAENENILYKIPKQEKEDSIYRRVAKFLVIIGEDEAAKILPHLAQEQIEKIVPEIASIRTIPPEEAEKILSEFEGLLKKSRQTGGVETARYMLEKAYGKEKASQMLENAFVYTEGKPFEYLNEADNERVYLLLKDESVNVQSLVLSHLEPKKAASVINLMTEQEKKEVVLKLAKMDKISPDVIKRVDKAMHEKSLKQTSEKAEKIDGRNALAQILKKMDPKAEGEIINVLSEGDPDLGQDLRNRLFTLEDVVKADDRFVQNQLQEMETPDICYLIAGKPDDFRDKILNNVSHGRKNEILDQEDYLKPMRRADCEKVTSSFFSVLRRAYDEGHLIIKDRNDDVYL